MSLFKIRQFLQLSGLTAGASILSAAEHTRSSTARPLVSHMAPAEATVTNDPFIKAYMKQAEAALQKEFKGITTQGQIIPKLYSIKPINLRKSTKLIQQAPDSLIATLNQQKQKTLFPINTIEWRRWCTVPN